MNEVIVITTINASDKSNTNNHTNTDTNTGNSTVYAEPSIPPSSDHMSPRVRTCLRLSTIFVVSFLIVLLLALPFLEARPLRGGNPGREMDGVKDVSGENYYDVVGHDRFVLLEFYAEWCGHCRNFASTYAEIGRYVAMRPDLADKVIVAKVNSPENPRLEKRYKVQGYPTILMVPPNAHKGVEFMETRDTKHLIDFIESQMLKGGK